MGKGRARGRAESGLAVTAHPRGAPFAGREVKNEGESSPRTRPALPAAAHAVAISAALRPVTGETKTLENQGIKKDA
jgi:hypothetical protein